MNWIISFLYLILSFIAYTFIGKVLLDLVGFTKDKITSEKKIIAGFIVVFFISFIIGVPCQLIHVSWNVYKFLMILILTFVIMFCIYKEKRDIKMSLIYIRDNLKTILINNIKEYWFLYLLVCLFTILSISNTLPYYRMNYDDSYYIGKIVNQVGSNALMSENFYNGSLISGYDGGITRILNTFEIGYGFFADIFHISIPFFCRVPMTVHNYLLTFLCFKEVANMFVKRKKSQFVLFPFAILLISSGFLMNSPHCEFVVRMYDGWQFQTAIFYGGSVVRVMAIPIIIIFGVDLIHKIELKKIIFMAIIYLVLISFSTIFITYAILLTYVFIFIKLINNFYKQYKNNKSTCITICLILILVFVLLLTKKLDTLSFINTENYNYNITEYNNFYAYYFGSDTFVRYAPFILTLCLFVYKNHNQKFAVLIVLIPFLIFYSNKFNELIVLSTVNNFFVALRFITSLQLMIILFLGICFVGIISCIQKSTIILSVISFFMAAGVSGYIYVNKNYIYEQDFLGSGMTKLGYSLDQIFANDEMMPEIMVDIGNYFNNLDYGNYTLALPSEIEYNNTTIPGVGFIIASNRIELCSRNGCNNMPDDDFNLINKYFSNELPYDEIKSILKEYSVQYILVTDINQRNELETNGFQVVLENNGNNNYFLLKSGY